MSSEEIELLREDVANMGSAASHLRVSLDRCAGLVGRSDLSLDEMERLEALSSRFARLADILTQRVMRLVDSLELLPGGSLLDRIFLAEKRGWVADADHLISIRKLRNTIAHDYAAEMADVYGQIVALAPELLTVAARAGQYAGDLIGRLESHR